MEVVAEYSPVEVEARAWLNGHKASSGLSWPQIGKLTDVASSTLSMFATGKYAGNNGAVAAKVLAYRDRLANQAQLAVHAPVVPSWYETPTAKTLAGLLHSAQSGEIVLIVTTPGIGKTKVAEWFAANDPNVWLATMSPSTSGVPNMAIEVGEAIGLGEIKGSPQQLSRQIKAHIQGKNGLLIIDEAQELTEKSLNEIRSWHDKTKVGIAIMGNESVVGQIDGRKSALAQISSRFYMRHTQSQPMAGDLEVLFDAWGIVDADQRAFLTKVSQLPGALREVTHTIKAASMGAFGAGQELTLARLRIAAKQRNVKIGAL